MVQFCQKFGFHDYFMKLPQNYLTLVGEEGINLSGDQQQMAIAMVTHRSQSVQLADRVYVMENGILQLTSDVSAVA